MGRLFMSEDDDIEVDRPSENRGLIDFEGKAEQFVDSDEATYFRGSSSPFYMPWSTRKQEKRPPKPRFQPTIAVPPQELTFELQQDCKAGEVVEIQGPTGPIPVKVDEACRKGERRTMYLGPSERVRVELPEDHVGDSVRVTHEGDSFLVPVPEGVSPGGTFECSPPTIMVQVPIGAKAGEGVVFFHPSQDQEKEHTAVVPEGFEPGSFFAVAVRG